MNLGMGSWRLLISLDGSAEGRGRKIIKYSWHEGILNEMQEIFLIMNSCFQ